MTFSALYGQVLRFLGIGALNTAVDFAVLNFLIAIFGLSEQDPKFTIFKIISFLVAVTNSYFFNRTWVFKSISTKTQKNFEVFKFFCVSIFSFALNVFVASIVYHLTSNLAKNYPLIVAANIGALGGAATSFVVNFLGYKFFVFRKNSKQDH